MVNKKMQSWINSSLYVSDANEGGKGVFAKKGIKKDEICAIFGGSIVTLEEESLLPEKNRDSGIQISDNFVMTSLKENEKTDFFNHSCDPNSGILGQIILVAMRDILIGEQVTFDYAMCVSSSESCSGESYSFKCNCSSDKCRGVVSDSDWKITRLQKKYKGYFSRYIQDKIDSIKKRKL